MLTICMFSTIVAIFATFTIAVARSESLHETPDERADRLGY